ncbi:MAG: RagB/SusD family nutrient uptake outer membrane protein [Paenibacillus sp.]|nr:RagB/SusD family nutrient uptake outer membrane protein [Paenibacillus sp.]
MKKIFRYIAAVSVALASVSCLELDPKEQLADPDLWNKAGDFQAFSNKFYDWFPNFDMVYSGTIHADKHSDILRDRSSSPDEVSAGINTVPSSDGDYSGNYDHIRRCCLLLEKSQGFANKAEIAQPLGEAYFFRAWCYFQLVQKFGNVIIVNRSLDTDDPLLFASRNDRGEVIDFIIDDLRNAISNLKPTAELADGRVGREGAQAFLGRVALFEGTWQKFRGNETRAKELLDISAKASKEVIDGNKFQLFYNNALGETSLKYLFILEDVQSNPAGLKKDANKEYILKRCFHPTLKKIGKNLNTEVLANAQYVSAKFANMYLCSDGLPIEKSPKFQGYGKATSEWQNRDLRMKTTLMAPGQYYFTNSAANSRLDWSGSDAELARAKWQPSWNSGALYFPQKWATEREVTDGEQSYDFPIIRYAEVLLNYAEAVYERDGHISNDDLKISINLTRQRLNKEMPALTNEFVSANGLDMRQEIRRERTIELFNEGFRLDDLKRWKTAETEMPMDFLGSRNISSSYLQNSDGNNIIETGRHWAEKNYLNPLPIDQLQLNPNLGQNPGW